MRKTEAKDAEQILRFLNRYYVENQEIMPMEIDFDLEDTWTFLNRAFQHPELISYISDDGIIMGEITQPWFSKTPVARGLVWYVSPKARNGILARSLLRAFDKEAQERGAKFSRMDFDNPAHLQMIDPFIRLMGYEDFSKVYLKRF